MFPRTIGKYKDYDTPAEGFADTIQVMKTLTPTHIMLNGTAGALLNENAMLADVGEKVLFITASCNIDARFHIIGGHADLVWNGGSFNDRPATNYETWDVPGGGRRCHVQIPPTGHLCFRGPRVDKGACVQCCWPCEGGWRLEQRPDGTGGQAA